MPHTVMGTRYAFQLLSSTFPSLVTEYAIYFMIVVYAHTDDEQAAKEFENHFKNIFNIRTYKIYSIQELQEQGKSEEEIIEYGEAQFKSLPKEDIVLIGGEAVNPIVKWLVYNKYAAGIRDIKSVLDELCDKFGGIYGEKPYEPCCLITLGTIENRRVYIIAGWEKEHTLWAVRICIYYNSLPVKEYCYTFDPNLHEELKSRGLVINENFGVVPFRLNHTPILCIIKLTTTFSTLTLIRHCDQLGKALSKQKGWKEIRVVPYPPGATKTDKISISGLIPPDKHISEAYPLVSGTVVMGILFAIAAIIWGMGYIQKAWASVTIKRLNNEERKLFYSTLKDIIEYCESQNIPLEKCEEFVALITEWDERVRAQEMKQMGMESLFGLMEKIIYVVMVVLLISMILQLIKR